MIKLNNKKNEILRRCIEKYRSNLLWIIDSLEVFEVNEELGNELMEIVGNELIEKGFEGDVPNEYGLLLEELIASIGNLFLEDRTGQ